MTNLLFFKEVSIAKFFNALFSWKIFLGDAIVGVMSSVDHDLESVQSHLDKVAAWKMSEAIRKVLIGFGVVLVLGGIFIIVFVSGVRLQSPFVLGETWSSGERHLTQEQKTTLIKSLRGQETRAIEIWAPAYPDTEAGRYAWDFVEVFLEGGWTVKRERMQPVPQPPALYFQSGDIVADALMKQLAKVDSEMEFSGEVYANPIKFIVGPRPVKD